MLIDSLGAALQTLRRRAKLTQDVLAERVGVTAPTVSRWETDRSPPSLWQLITVLDACEATDEERAQVVELGRR